jgi:hypothetical protein
MASDHDDVLVLAIHECLDLLRTVEVGRLAVSRTEHPDVFPVNYTVDHGTVVFRTAPGTKLDALTGERNVTFEVDGYHPASGEAWSVIIKGWAERITAPHERVDAVDLPLFPWHTGPKPHFVRVVPVEITGRRFHAMKPTDAQLAASPPHRAADE